MTEQRAAIAAGRFTRRGLLTSAAVAGAGAVLVAWNPLVVWRR